MNVSRTDSSSSIESNEFEWDASGFTEVHKFVLPPLRKILERKMYHSIIDIGCGNGVLTNELRKQSEHCVGTDFSKSGIEIARKCYPCVDFYVTPVEAELPVQLHNAFELAVSVEVIEHLLLPRQLFARAKEALKPGGDFIISTPYHGYFKNIALALLNKFDAHWHPLRDYGHVKFFSIKTLNDLFLEQGFEVVDTSRVGRVSPLARSVIMRGTLRA